MFSKNPVTSIIIVFLILGIGIGWFIISLNKDSKLKDVPQEPVVVEQEIKFPIQEIIGSSVEGRDINAYTYGDGVNHILFIAGIHGGYEWNSTFLANKFIDHIDANPGLIPENVTVTIIPSANPDGLFRIVNKPERFNIEDVPTDESLTIPGRFNANEVDLNRNFDCRWQPESTWRGNVVSAGTEVFSEPETIAIRDFVLEKQPNAIISWHSQANAVYASECGEGILPETTTLMNSYAIAASYNAIDSFDAYPVTGDAESWFASIGIPAVTVELETHHLIDWDRNLSGIKAIFDYFAKK